MVVAVAYISLSGLLAEKFASSTQDLFAIEIIKGFGFVAVTGLLLFVLCSAWVKKLNAQKMLLVQSERKAMATVCCASIAHDLNNLLMALNGLLEELKDHEKNAEAMTAMHDDFEDAIYKITKSLKSLSNAAKELAPKGDEEVDLDRKLPLIIRLVSRHPDLVFCNLKIRHLPSLVLNLNSMLFEQAVMNLIINAAQATGQGGKIRLDVEYGDKGVEIQVHDNGPGIPLGDGKSIFTPGYTTKATGSGLGLLSVNAFAESCKGTVVVDQSDLGGVVFKILIPPACVKASGSV